MPTTIPPPTPSKLEIRPWRRLQHLESRCLPQPDHAAWPAFWAAVDDPCAVVRFRLATALKGWAGQPLPSAAITALHLRLDDVTPRGWYHLAALYAPLQGQHPEIDARIAGALPMLDTDHWQTGDRETVQGLLNQWTQHSSPQWIETLPDDTWLDAYVLASDHQRLRLLQQSPGPDWATVFVALLAHPQLHQWSQVWQRLHHAPISWSSLLAEGWLRQQRRPLPADWWLTLADDPDRLSGVCKAIAELVIEPAPACPDPRHSLSHRQIQEAALSSLTQAQRSLAAPPSLRQAWLTIHDHSPNPQHQSCARRAVLAP